MGESSSPVTIVWSPGRGPGLKFVDLCTAAGVEPVRLRTRGVRPPALCLPGCRFRPWTPLCKTSEPAITYNDKPGLCFLKR